MTRPGCRIKNFDFFGRRPRFEAGGPVSFGCKPNAEGEAPKNFPKNFCKTPVSGQRLRKLKTKEPKTTPQTIRR